MELVDVVKEAMSLGLHQQCLSIGEPFVQGDRAGFVIDYKIDERDVLTAQIVLCVAELGPDEIVDALLGLAKFALIRMAISVAEQCRERN